MKNRFLDSEQSCFSRFTGNRYAVLADVKNFLESVHVELDACLRFSARCIGGISSLASFSVAVNQFSFYTTKNWLKKSHLAFQMLNGNHY